MQNFDIVRETEAVKSFRVAAVMSAFDLQTSHIREHFSGSIDLSEPWNIGLIVGGSGTGKSTIAKELFSSNYIKQYDYKSQCVLDDMPQGKSIDEITSAFSSVGFSSPPSWLKSYSVLSMGEKMRCDLARAILEENELIVFDEFTSVVDRIVAKTGSLAINKAIKRLNKKFIAISCHRDIIEWLQPDWIFDTDKMKFFRYEGTRPEMRCGVIQLDRGKDLWQKFRRYHYLDTELNHSSKCYALVYEGTAIGFCAIMHFPHPKNKKIKRVHRLVILPDYQGIGAGRKFLSYIGEIYKKDGWDFRIISSSRSIYHSLLQKPGWILERAGRASCHPSETKSRAASLRASGSHRRISFSFEYLPPK